jgi:hypothetical protein
MVKRAVRRTIGVIFRLSPTEKRALDNAAIEEDRAIASIVRRLVLEWLEAKGYLK